MRGFKHLEELIHDVQYGFRGMRRTPVFAATAIVTLALTTAAISTVFTLANTLLFRTPDVQHPANLVVVSPTRRHATILGSTSYQDYLHFRDQNRTLQAMAAHYSTAPLFVVADGHAMEINGSVVTANYFPLLGIQPEKGRFFASDEDAVPDRDRVAVISHNLWRSWFGSSPAVLGKAIKVNGEIFTVIGVSPPTFHGLAATPSEIYIPMMMLRLGYRWCKDSLIDQNCTILDMIGRLAEGRTLAEAKADMARLVPERWKNAPPGDNTGITVHKPEGADRNESSSLIVRLLALTAGALLLVCCANMAGLLLVRGVTRVREFAIRVSMGASRLRLVRQLMTEAVLLGVLGGVLGVWLSVALTRALGSLFYTWDSEGHPLYFNFGVTPSVLVSVLIVATLAALLFGLVAAMFSTRLSPFEYLKRESSSATARSKVGHWLVSAQAAVAVGLVSVAALLIANAHKVESGMNFESSHVALMRLRPRLLNYPSSKAVPFHREVVQRLEALPGVESVSMVDTGAVLKGFEAMVSTTAWHDPLRQNVRAVYIEIGPRYFETLHIPLLRGREFSNTDNTGSPPVAIVSQTLAHRLFPTGEEMGASILVNQKIHQVVGVVADVPLVSRAEAYLPYVYVPIWQNANVIDARYCIRVKGDPAAMLPLLSKTVNQVDPDVPIAETITLPIQLAGWFRPLRMSATFLAFAAGLGILLSAVGLYGILSFLVSRRTKEIGIRIALGATKRGVLAMFLREGMLMVLPSIPAGVGLAFAGTKIVSHLVLQSTTGDALFYVAAGLLTTCVGLLACWIPARRAAKVEPMTALREE